MPSLDDVLAALFASLGPIGSLLALLLIFAVDAALFPALPEAWILITYTFRPETMDAVGWAAVLLLVAVTGDLLGTSILYALVRRILVRGRRMPRWLESGMRRWTEFLGVPDERAILLYLVFVIGVAYDPRTARSITLVLVVVVVAMSVLGSWLYRRRGRGRKAS